MKSQSRFGFLDEINELPTLPIVVSRVSELIESPNSSAEDITKVLETDPSLTAKILKLVNSAYYALPKRISSVRQAVVILGFATVKSLAISASVFDMFGSSSSSPLDKELFWQHSIGCATVSKVFAKHVPGINEEDAFVIGLLHDIGKLVMDQYRPDEFTAAYRTAERWSSSLYKAEIETLEFNHAQVGGWLAEKWKLPQEIVQSINFHHAPPPIERIKLLVGICHFANYACKVKRVGSAGDFCPAERNDKFLEPLNLDKLDMSRIIKDINAELENALALYKSAQN